MTTISPKNSAFISVDNTRTFEDKSLNELYVPEGEQAALNTKTAADICKSYGILTINILEEHPIGHISLAANYTNKHPGELITYDEVQSWTKENNGIEKRATFNVSELKKFLSEVGEQRLWPDHSIQNTSWVELTPPLQAADFDLKIIKWTNPAKEAYSGFDETQLDNELKTRKIKKLFITWVATDYCSWKTAKDAAELNYDVYMITDAIRWVTQEKTQEMISILEAKAVKFITIHELEELLQKNISI